MQAGHGSPQKFDLSLIFLFTGALVDVYLEKGREGGHINMGKVYFALSFTLSVEKNILQGL